MKNIPYIPAVLTNFDKYKIKKEKNIISNLENIGFLTNLKEKKIYKDKIEILKKIIRKEKNLYFFNKKILRSLDEINLNIILNCDLTKLEKIKNKKYTYFYPLYNLTLVFGKKIEYYTYILDFSFYFSSFKEIEDKEGRIYTGKEIISFLKDLGEREVFKFKVKYDSNIYLGSKDFSLFFILNQDFLKKIKIGNFIDKENKIRIKPLNLDVVGLSNFIDVFLDYTNEDYEYEYEDLTKLDLSVKEDKEYEAYTKKDLKQRGYDFNHIIKKLEDNLETRYVPRKLD